MLLLLSVLTDCRGQWQWVEEVRAVPTCPGGRVDIERRNTRVIAGNANTTITRTNTCLE